jgi:deoxyadenosine/deoxycytidine kinase
MLRHYEEYGYLTIDVEQQFMENRSTSILAACSAGEWSLTARSCALDIVVDRKSDLWGQP